MLLISSLKVLAGVIPLLLVYFRMDKKYVGIIGMQVCRYFSLKD